MSFARGGGQVEYRWSGNKVIARLEAAANRALQRAANAAFDYWNEVIWTRENHPYMTGREAAAGRFLVFAGGDALRPRLIGLVDMTEDYPRYVEFGTAYMEPTFPLRRTMDWIAPRIRAYLNQELKATLQGGAG